MEEGGGDVEVTGEEEQGEVGCVRYTVLLGTEPTNTPLMHTPTLQEWVITSPLHLAAYAGDIPQLQEALKDSNNTLSLAIFTVLHFTTTTITLPLWPLSLCTCICVSLVFYLVC